MEEEKAHGKKHHAAKSDVKININSNCKTDPQKVTLTSGDTLQFKCGAGKLFGVRLDGDVFVGHPEDFVLVVNGPTPVPDPALVVEADVEPDEMSNYVFDMSGNNCQQKEKFKTDPPDIIIENS